MTPREEILYPIMNTNPSQRLISIIFTSSNDQLLDSQPTLCPINTAESCLWPTFPRKCTATPVYRYHRSTLQFSLRYMAQRQGPERQSHQEVEVSVISISAGIYLLPVRRVTSHHFSSPGSFHANWLDSLLLSHSLPHPERQRRDILGRHHTLTRSQCFSHRPTQIYVFQLQGICRNVEVKLDHF